jgi:enolase
VVGDDLTTTSKERIQTALQSESIDAVIIKPNQIGTLSETIEAIKTAKENELHCYASHRSGETNDPFIVDIAVGLHCHGMKIGALQRGERISKYNRLRKLYEETTN